jgi:hypothetical protein
MDKLDDKFVLTFAAFLSPWTPLGAQITSGATTSDMILVWNSALTLTTSLMRMNVALTYVKLLMLIAAKENTKMQDYLEFA